MYAACIATSDSCDLQQKWDVIVGTPHSFGINVAVESFQILLIKENILHC